MHFLSQRKRLQNHRRCHSEASDCLHDAARRCRRRSCRVYSAHFVNAFTILLRCHPFAPAPAHPASVQMAPHPAISVQPSAVQAAVARAAERRAAALPLALPREGCARGYQTAAHRQDDDGGGASVPRQVEQHARAHAPLPHPRPQTHTTLPFTCSPPHPLFPASASSPSPKKSTGKGFTASPPAAATTCCTT